MGFLWTRKDNPVGAEAPTSRDGPGAGTVATEAVREEIRKSRAPRSKTADRMALVEQEAQLDALYAEENWEAIGALYFDGRYAITGWRPFRLEEAERKMLAASLSAMMRSLIKIDPAYVALIIFSVNFGSLITTKELAYRAFLAEEKGDGRGK